MDHSFRRRGISGLLTAAAVLVGAAGSLIGSCGPFTDFTDAAFCPFVLEIFYLGITTGTTPSTYDPASSVTRLQMAAFLSRTVDSTARRGSRRAAANRFWTTQNAEALDTTTVGTLPRLLRSDGADVWVANQTSGSVSRVRESDGRLLETWTGADSAFGILVAMGRIFATGATSPGSLYRIDPSQPAGAVTIVASNLGDVASGIAFDGGRIWTGNFASPGGTVSIVTPGATIPWTVTTFNVGAGETSPYGVVYDGARIWVTDRGLGTLLKLDAAGGVLQTVTVGTSPGIPAFDGGNLWVPNTISASVTVVRASNGTVLQTLTGNGLSFPAAAGFDGERILVANVQGHSVSLWKAADLTPLGTFPTGGGTNPFGACSDGLGFWITLAGAGKIARV